MSERSSTRSDASASLAIESDNILYGWTFHQSHDQATVLFLVPQSVSAKQLDIQIGTNYICAGVHGFPPVIKAKLYGRVNVDTSSWRVADRDHDRSKRRSRSISRSSKATSSNDALSPNMQTRTNVTRSSAQPQHPSVSSGTTSPDTPSSRPTAKATESLGASHSSLSASFASLQSGSSYEMISNSAVSQSQFALANFTTDWSSASSDFGSSDSVEAVLSQSAVLSEPENAHAQANSAGSKPRKQVILRRSRSSADLASGASTSTSDRGANVGKLQRSRRATQRSPPEVRLVTLHLEKVDSGIWPLLVVGPAPLQISMLPSRMRRALEEDIGPNVDITESYIEDRIKTARKQRQDVRQRTVAQHQLNYALEEALGRFGGVDRLPASLRQALSTSGASYFHEGSDSDEEIGPGTSTLSINTIGSDESATVLGTRVASLSSTYETLAQGSAAPYVPADEESDEEELEVWKELELEARFNMDPTTLSLIGLQYADRRSFLFTSGTLKSLTPASASGIPVAFEYFARAWRAAEIGLATERLVQEYLPLLPTQGANSPQAIDISVMGIGQLNALGLLLLERARHLPPTIEVIAPALRGYLPSQSYMSQRQRLVASLGGTRSLARLYLSYGRLHLPSLSEFRSPLAFPYGQLTSPFVSGRDTRMPRASKLQHLSGYIQTTATSSRASSTTSSRGDGSGPNSGGAVSPSKTINFPSSPAHPPTSGDGSPDQSASNETHGVLDLSDFIIGDSGTSIKQPGPFYFFQEACSLDADLQLHITSEEWRESLEIAVADEVDRRAELEGLAQAEEMGSLAGDGQSGCLAFDSDTDVLSNKAIRRSKRTGRASEPPSHKYFSTDRGVVGLFGFSWSTNASTDEQHCTSSRKRSSKSSKHPDKTKRRKERRNRKAAESETGVINFVSGAALLGVALAGSVAALGWWRRTSAAFNSAAA